MIFVLRDRLLADKAMDLVYERAKVTEVEPKPAPQEPAAPADGAEAQA
jgi:trigger factor